MFKRKTLKYRGTFPPAFETEKEISSVVPVPIRVSQKYSRSVRVKYI